MPCIYRRAALHSAGLDSERYGLDFCKGEVDFNATDERGPADLRACLSFLRKNYDSEQLKTFLLANGVLDIGKMDEYSALISSITTLSVMDRANSPLLPRSKRSFLST
jgi:hypothetical protein